MDHMNIILLSGGSGKRLWPLSNAIRSKQFLKLFRNDKGEYESMVQRVYRQIRSVDRDANVTIATSKAQEPAIRNQLGTEVGVCVEPCRRDTFPAIVLAVAYLRDVQHVDPNETVVVCPVDPLVDDDYFEALKKLASLAEKGAVDGSANLTLMGIEPTYPSEKYGYIIPTTKDTVGMVRTFKEKPDEATARSYIEQGALWNSGVFAFRISWLLERAKKLLDFSDYDDLLQLYETATKISFDYAVAEKEPKIQVMRFNGRWTDLGTWNTLVEAMSDSTIGKVMTDGTCSDISVVNELDVPIIAMGLKDVVIAASPEGVLVADKTQSSYMKPLVDKIDQHIMFAEHSWGSYKVINVEDDSLTIKVTLRPCHSMNYHSHEHRDEIWNVISGCGVAVVDGMKHSVKPGDVITMQAGCRHTIIAETELEVIEVQLGSSINVGDKKIFPLEL